MTRNRKRNLVGKVVIPALLVLVMVVGAWGTAIVPSGAPARSGGTPTAPTSLRSGNLPSLLGGGGNGGTVGQGGDASMGVQGNSVSKRIMVNEDLVGRTDMKPVPAALGYDPISGRAWNQFYEPLTIDPAYLPQKATVSFASKSLPRTETTSGPDPNAGGVDAGGPYGGPTTFEGDTIEFTASVSDPNLIFFRWDFNNDGKWDTGVVGNPWVSDLTVRHTYYDDFYDVVTVDAWDGISSTSTHFTGWTLGTPPPFWYLYYYYDWTIGYKFKAKQTMTVNQLSFNRYSDDPVYGDYATLWDANSQAKLAECLEPSGFDWVRCDLSTPVTLQSGKDYVVSQRLGDGSFGFGFYYARGIDKPADTDQVAFDGTYYTLFTPVPAFPGTFWTDQFIPTIEFYYDYALTFPKTVSDNAQVTVNNVAPIVYDLSTNPSQLLEGTPAQFSAMFTDPGLDDQWQFRWCYGDGTCDDWGGIKVGSGLSQLQSILVYSDVAPHYATMALDFYGVSYKFTSDIFAMPGLLNQQHWDLIIYQSYYIAFFAPIIQDGIMTQLNAGSLVMYNDWAVFLHAQHPMFSYFGGQWLSDLFSPLTMYVWDPSNDLFNIPLTPPSQMDPTHNQFFRDGQLVKVLSNAFDPMGYTPNRQSGESSLIVRNDLTTIWNAFTPQNYQADQNFDGDVDVYELLVNEVRLLTGPEIPRSMPWPVPTVKHVYRDDNPSTGTPSDGFTPTLELKDDDDGKLRGGHIESLTDFSTGSPWPTGWSLTQGFAWQREFGFLSGQSADYWYYFDWSEAVHVLQSQSWDLSAMDPTAPVSRVTLTWDNYWQSGYSAFDPLAYQDGYVEASTDDFATSTLLTQYHENDPTVEQMTVSYDVTEFAGASNFRVHFSVQGYDDWWWMIDNVDVSAAWGIPIEGFGSGSTQVTVNNVPPTMYGGAQSGLTGEATPFDFVNYKIQDPTLWNPRTGAWDPVPTEWFAYRWNFDDGTMSDWSYKGTLEVPKLRVLFIHTLSFGTGSGFLNLLRSIDVVGQMDDVDFLFLGPADVPTVDQMLGYDVVIFATNWATFSSTFDLTRRTIGNNLADYLDISGGAVVTLMATYDNSPFYGDLFTLLGRYVEDDYGAFQKTTYGFTPGSLGTVYEPDHPVMQGVHRLTSPFIHSGDYSLTEGAQLLADWDDGNSAIAVKELPNGGRSVNIGGFSGQDSDVCGGDCVQLLRNSIVWASKKTVPTNDVVPQLHTFGDNGLYNVDLQMIDDDMGFAWDFDANAPMAIPGETPTISHNVIPVEIYNQDPTIDTSSVQAFVAANVCLRVSGKEWNTVDLGLFTDGIQSAGVTVTRMSGSPNDQTKCAFAKVDLLAAHDFSVVASFTPLSGATSGDNPYWVIIAPWREPITPGHGTVTVGGSFNVGDVDHYVNTMELGNLKQELLDSGRGARIEFSAVAGDPGTDDLAFVWMWGDGAIETVNVHNNLDGSVTQGAIGDPQLLGFSEPFFDRASNSIRTPEGTTNFVVQDGTSHVYSGSGRFFWVVLIVLDDDNTRGYPSAYAHDGTDMEFILVDLT